jgi:hypothetical protein
MIKMPATQGEAFSANLKTCKKIDVVVVGSGPAGCLAALSARRNGASTLMIERESFLGGQMTGGGIGGIGINGYFADVEGKPVVVKGISLEVFKRLQNAGGAPPGALITRPQTDPEVMIHLLDELMEEANVEVLFNTIAFDAVMQNNTVKGVAIANKSGGQVILADVVVDASADGDIFAAAGASFEHGRPQDGRHHGGSMDMQISGIDVEKFVNYFKSQPILTEEERKQLEDDRSRLLGSGRAPNIALSIEGEPIVREYNITPTSWDDVEKDMRAGKVPHFRLSMTSGGPRPGIAAIKDGKYIPMPALLDKEWIDYIKSGKVPPLLGAARLVYPPPRYGSVTGLGIFRNGMMRNGQLMSGIYECWFDQTNQEEISKAIIYMRKINKVYLTFLRERIPGFENAYIVMESPNIGTRESRRLVGEYVLNEEDLISGRRFPDVIAKGGPRGPDAHSVTGLWGDGVASKYYHVYDIPYRSLVPQKIDNLLVAGRCISATHLAFGAIRDQATCMSTGEAAGAAAAISVRSGVLPRNIDVKVLQKALLKQGALLFLEDEKNKEKELLSYVPNNE